MAERYFTLEKLARLLTDRSLLMPITIKRRVYSRAIKERLKIESVIDGIYLRDFHLLEDFNSYKAIIDGYSNSDFCPDIPHISICEPRKDEVPIGLSDDVFIHDLQSLLDCNIIDEKGPGIRYSIGLRSAKKDGAYYFLQSIEDKKKVISYSYTDIDAEVQNMGIFRNFPVVNIDITNSDRLLIVINP